MWQTESLSLRVGVDVNFRPCSEANVLTGCPKSVTLHNNMKLTNNWDSFFHLSFRSNSPPKSCVSEASFWKWWEVKTLLNVFRSSQNRRWCHNLASLPPIFSPTNAMNGIFQAQNSLNTQSCIKGPFCCTFKFENSILAYFDPKLTFTFTPYPSVLDF